MQPATGLVLTMNSGRFLPRTLSSLDFCAKLLVVDSGSSDNTLDMARSFGARILQRPWDGIVNQFRFALEHVDTPWVVSLDSDEALDDTLKADLVRALADPGEAAGFAMDRRSFYFDRFITHSGWYPETAVRAFCADRVTVAGDVVHHEFKVDGPTPRLAGDIVHYPYTCLADHLERINRYAQATAIQNHGRGARSSVSKALGRGAARFAKHYIIKRGFLDGRAGLVLALHGAFYAFQKYLRLAELSAHAASPDQGRPNWRPDADRPANTPDSEET